VRHLPSSVVAAVSVLSAAASAETVITFRQGVSPTAAYSGCRDVVLTDGADFFWEPDRNFNGRADVVLDGSPQDQLGLFRWDLSPFLLPGDVVNSADIVLTASSGTSNTYEIYECLQDWVDSEATWNQYRLSPDGGQARWVLPGAQAWADGGAGPFDNGGVVLGGATGTGTLTIPLNAAGVAMVQRWVDTPSGNRGVAVFDLAAGDDLILRSAEYGTATARPRLRVFFNGGPVPIEFANGSAPSVSYAGGKDTFIAFGPDPRTVNWNSLDNGTDGSTQAESTLISWSVTAIPPWSTVRAASFELFMTNNSVEVYPVYQAIKPWGETTATWYTTDGVTPWAAPGAASPLDKGSTPLAYLTTSLIDVPVTFDLLPAGVQLVQDWVSGAQPNYGFLAQAYVYPDGGLYSDGLNWETRSDTTLTERPALSVRYTEGDLVLAPAPGALGAGASSAPFVVRRERPDGGTPLGTGLPVLNVQLASTSGTGEFSANRDPLGTWSSPYPVTISAGASASAPIYYRDRAPGLATVGADAGPTWDTVRALVDVRPEALVDDFESPGRLVTDVPAGPWTGRVERQAATIAAAAAAAHRGTAGLRVTDPDALTGQGAVTELSFVMAPRTGDFYARTWIRVNSTSAAGSLNPIQILNNQAPGANAMAEVILDAATGALSLGGYDRGGYLTTPAAGSLVAGRWTLIELAVDGANGAAGSGRRRLWVDAQLVAERTGLDFSGTPWAPQAVELGQPWSDDRTFTGTIDFDDVRLSVRPQLSHQRVTVPSSTYPVGSCIPVTVDLHDSVSGGPQPAREPVDLTLSAAGVAGAFFSAGTCTGSSSTALALPAGQASGTVYFRVDGYGTLLLRADSADLVAIPSAAVTVPPGALPDHARVRVLGPNVNDTCTPLQVETSIVDSTGAVVPGAVDVSVCADAASGAVVQATTLGGATTGGRCATGITGPSGTATVDFTSTVAETAAVTATRAGLPGAPVTASLTWRPGSASAARSELLVEGSGGPVLVPGGGAVVLRVVPRDACGGATSARLQDVQLLGPAELAVSMGAVQIDGSVVFNVSLPLCPSEGTFSFPVRAQILGADVQGGTGMPVVHALSATCAAPRFTSPPPAYAQCGMELRYLPLVEGPGPYQFDLQAAAGAAPLPPGLTADPETGEIRWTPAAAGTVSADLRVQTGGGTAKQRLEVTVDCTPYQLQACGCQGAGGGAAAILALLLAVARRRRR